MIKTMTLRAGLLALGLTLSACAEYTPGAANCFDEQGAKTTPHLSTKGSVVAVDDTGCSFTALGAAN